MDPNPDVKVQSPCFNQSKTIRVVADTRHRGDNGSRLQVDDPYRPARLKGGSLPSGNDCIAAVQGHRRAFWAGWEYLAIRLRRAGQRNPHDLGAWITGKSP